MKRKLSPLEIVFWRLAEAGSLNVTTIATVHGRVTEEALRAGLEDLQGRHPLLAVRISAVSGVPQFETTDVPDLPLRFVQGGASDITRIIEEEINQRIDAQRGPLARCAWLQHDEQNHTILITTDHVISDGMSGVYMMRDLVQATAAQLANRTDSLPPRLQENVPIDLRLPAQARGLRAALGQARFVARVAWDDIRLRPPARPHADKPSSLGSRRTRLICRVIDATSLEHLADKARQQGTTVHGALSAAICLAIANDNSSTHAMSIKHRTPVNMRSVLDPPVAQDVGLFVSMAFYRGRVKAADDFWSLARAIRADIKKQIDRGGPALLIGMLPRLYNVIRGDKLNAADFAAKWQQRTPSTTGLTNLGRVQLSEEMEPLEISELHFAVSPGGLGDWACTATTFNDNLRWNFLYADPHFSGSRAHRITDDAVERLERVMVR